VISCSEEVLKTSTFVLHIFEWVNNIFQFFFFFFFFLCKLAIHLKLFYVSEKQIKHLEAGQKLNSIIQMFNKVMTDE